MAQTSEKSSGSLGSIFNYLDYRDYLKDYDEERKKKFPLFSYQMFGMKLNISASHLFSVLEKKRHLPVRCVPAAKKILGLSGRTAQYFDLLLAALRTKKLREHDELMSKAFQLRDIHRHSLEKEELTYLHQWWNVVIRSFLQINQGKIDPKGIANNIRPKLSEEQVKESIELLKKIGLVTNIGHGRVKLSDAHLTIGGAEKFKAIREFQSQVMDLAKSSLQEIPPAERDVSTLTMAIDEDCFEDVKCMLQEFRRQIQIRIEEVPVPSRVMQLNLSFFPVSQDMK